MCRMEMSRRTHDASKSDVAGRGIDGLALARRRAVAHAIIGGAQVGAALHDPARIAVAGGARPAAGSLKSFDAKRNEHARGPLPHVTNHVVKAVAVRRERIDCSGALVTVAIELFPRKPALPGIGHGASVRREYLAPGVGRAVEAAAGRELPFGLGRQDLASPCRVGAGILVGDVDDRMVVTTIEVAVRSVRMSPV